MDGRKSRRYDRSKLRYPSDLTNQEWALVEPLISPPRRGSAKRTVNVPRGRQRPHVRLEHGLSVAGDL